MFKGKRSFFTELLISFLLLLCIPIITILLILWQSNRIVKEQVLDIESKSLHLYVEQLEEVMGGMKDTASTIFSTSECQLYAFEYVDNLALAKDLRIKIEELLKYQTSSKYYDVFVYYHRNDKIISGRYSAMNADAYYASYYTNFKLNPDSKEAFFNVLKTDYKKPVCHIINAGSENSYLCMTMGARDSRKPESNYTVCVVLDPVYLERTLVMQNGNTESVFQVYNTEKELLFSNNSKEDVNATETLKWEGKENDVWLDEKDFMIQIKESSKLDNYYVYAVQEGMFWDTLQWLRIWGFIGTGLCVMISFFFAYRSAVRAYRPVGNIMEFLKYKKGHVPLETAKSEFLYIVNFVENQEKVLKEKNKISREWFLHGLLEGKNKNVNEAVLEKNNIVFNGEKFAVCIIHADILSAEMEDLCSFVVQNVLEELCNLIGRAYFVDVSKNRYALLVNMSGEDIELYEVLREGQEFLQQKFQIILSVGYSDSHEGIQAIPEAYKEAQETIRYRFLLGSGRMIGYKDIKQRSVGCRNDEESKVLMLLLEYIENRKEEEELDNFVEQLMYVYQMNEEMSMDVALVFKNEIINALRRAMELCSYEEETTRRICMNLKNTATLSDFQQQLSCQITELCKCKRKRKSSDDVLEELKRIIEEKYSDTELSIAKLGAQIGMQPAHMAKVFKEKYGITLLDYIAGVRISHAKHMLREGKGSIQEVGEKSGFLSSQVFIRTFKKKEGITPGKYREMVKKG